jgi:hypothetical protein
MGHESNGGVILSDVRAAVMVDDDVRCAWWAH